MSDLVLSYYFVLREVLRSRPHLRPCLSRCRHCRIFFLSHPRNRCRQDLGCPFGCRDAHRRKRSTQRSTNYNRTETGKKKKARLNAMRRPAGDSRDGLAEASEENELNEINELEFDAGIVDHVVLVTSLIEGFAVRREEVVTMLRRIVRQRSILGEGRRDYFVRWLAEHPPQPP